MAKKKILLLSDDLRMSSGIANVSKQLVMGTVDKYDWVIFFSVSAALCIPGILVYYLINYKHKNSEV